VKKEGRLKVLGRHLLVEYYGCDPEILNGLEKVKEHMLEAASQCGATVMESSFHYFSPHGVSGVVVIAESHLAIHTWPEYGYAAVDIFTCGTRVDPWAAFHHLKLSLGSKESSVREIMRGEIPYLEGRLSRRSI
jgi:S-adenosylmethionine decarboxylase proenzyme